MTQVTFFTLNGPSDTYTTIYMVKLTFSKMVIKVLIYSGIIHIYNYCFFRHLVIISIKSVTNL